VSHLVQRLEETWFEVNTLRLARLGGSRQLRN
jgi:hypothetical protein